MNTKAPTTPRGHFSFIKFLLWLGALFLLVRALQISFSQIFYKSSQFDTHTLPAIVVTRADQVKPTVPWNTYYDPIYKYSIQYPPHWTVVPVKDGPEKDTRINLVASPISAGDDEASEISIIVYDNISALTGSQWVETQILSELSQSVVQTIKREQFIVGGVVGEQVVGLPSRFGTLEVYVPAKQRIYRFILTPYNLGTPAFSSVSQEYSEVFHSVLDTFEAP